MPMSGAMPLNGANAGEALPASSGWFPNLSGSTHAQVGVATIVTKTERPA